MDKVPLCLAATIGIIPAHIQFDWLRALFHLGYFVFQLIKSYCLQNQLSLEKYFEFPL